jgi:hypothetical protein
MGLDAYVRCNCYREGKAKPFPLPELKLSLNGDLLEEFRSLTKEQRSRHFQWQQTACEHPGFAFAFKRISNWFGVRAFQEALESAGVSNFPTLSEQLPNANGGEVSSELAARILVELDYFRHHADLGQDTWLVDSETGKEIFNYIAAYNGIFMWSEYRCGVDPEGFFIAQPDPNDRTQLGNEMFRSMRFEQRVLAWKDDGTEAKVEFFDAASERRFVWNQVAVTCAERQEDGKLNSTPIRLGHVITRRKTAEDFNYILTPLETVCRASIETGNPIVWC